MMSKILMRINIALKLNHPPMYIRMKHKYLIHIQGQCNYVLFKEFSEGSICSTKHLQPHNTDKSPYYIKFKKAGSNCSINRYQAIVLQHNAIRNTDNTKSCKMAPPMTLHVEATSSLQIFSNTNSKETIIL